MATLTAERLALPVKPARRASMDVKSQIALGRNLEGQGLLAQAIAAYNEVIASHPGEVEPLLLKAALHKELDQLDLASAALEKAEEVAPAAYEPKLRLAQLATSTGRDVAAIRYLQAAIDAHPDLAELRVNLADISSRIDWLDVGYWAVFRLPEALPDWWARARKTSIERFATVRQELRDLLRYRRQLRAFEFGVAWDIAQRLFALGRLRAAELLCDQLIDHAPDVFPPHELKAKVVGRREGIESAVDYMRGLSEPLMSSRDYPTRLARFLNELKRHGEVWATLEQRPDVAETFDARYLSTIALLSLSRTEELRAHCASWLRQSPEEVLPAAVMLGTVPLQPVPESDGAEKPFERLVQFWDKRNVPTDVLDVLDSWPKMHPHLQRALYSEEAARAFLRDRFGDETVEVFDLCHHAAMKADFFRITYLYAVGGLYVDADERCVKPMTALLNQAAKADFAAVRSGDLMGYLHNFFLAAQPGSRVMEIAIEDASRTIRQAHAEQRRPSIWHATGPGLLTRAASLYLAERPERDQYLLLMPFQQYRNHVRTAGELVYKRQSDANWQLT